MGKYYKLTNKDGQSYGGTQWKPGVTHEAEGEGMRFCSSDLLHLYSHPLLAVFLNPIHANFEEGMRLWEVEAEIVASDRGLKLGTKKATCLQETFLPQVSLTQKVRFGILCALQVNLEGKWRDWANNWLSGKDRSERAAGAAARAAAGGAAAGAALAAVWAARAAAWAASSSELDLIALAEEAMKEA